MSPPTVCVVGAGTVGLEGLLCARELLGAEAKLRLITPEREFRYRPMSGESLFEPAAERSLAIAELAARAGAAWTRDSAIAVHQSEREVLTRDGDTVGFDYLLLAPEAREERALTQGHVWEHGGDPSFLDEIIAGLASGAAGSVAVVIPPGVRWPIPAYELALVLAWTSAGTGARFSVITAEARPLQAIGAEATRTVSAELEQAGVQVIAGVEVADAPLTPGPDAGRISLQLGHGGNEQFDHLISLPAARGPQLGGVATDADGFIEVDAGLKVCGSERLWAAGDCLSSALELSALGAQQADAAIAAIAHACGVTSEPVTAPDLTGVLLSGQRERWLAENPPGTRQPSTRCLWWPPGRAVGRLLAREISAADPSLHGGLPNPPEGVAISTPVELGCSDGPGSEPADVSLATRTARRRDIENRQLMAIHRREHEAGAELTALDARLRALAHDQSEVIQELQHHGYLLDRRPVDRRRPSPRPA